MLQKVVDLFLLLMGLGLVFLLLTSSSSKPASRPSSQTVKKNIWIAREKKVTKPSIAREKKAIFSFSSIRPLSLKKAWTLQPPSSGRFDPSGLVYWPPSHSLLTVDDKLHQVKIFSIPLKHSRSLVDVKSVRLFFHSRVAVKRPMSDVWRGYRLGLDLEAITSCGSSLWVAAEQTRTLIRIEPSTGVATHHTLNLREYGKTSALDRHPMPGMSRDHNASFEGLACDEKHKRLYVIQERQPRLILQVRLPITFRHNQVLKIVDHFDLPSFHLPHRYGQVDSEPDFSGAAMNGKSLYVLYRNARLILKVDPIQHKLMDVRSYHHAVKHLYRLSKPFGLAEGIVVRGHRIWIALDNNGKPRWGRRNDRRPVLLEFARPSGF